MTSRRQSVSPAPAPTPASGTNSTAGSSRQKGKGVDKASLLKKPGAGLSNTRPNGLPSKPLAAPTVQEKPSIDHQQRELANPSKSLPPKSQAPVLKPKPKSRKSIKTKKRHSNKGISIFDILARLFLLWFTIYTLSVCPEDVELRSPVCRALTEYRRLILEPYVYPPIRAALDHPSIAPHVQRAQPYYNRAVQTTTPWVRRGRHEWRTQVVPRLQWLQIRSRPYVRRVGRQYDATIGPYARQVLDKIAQYKARTDPYILSLVHKTHRKWRRARPYVIPLWRGASHVPGILVRMIGGPLGNARRQWVDPQVVKIWAAVVEKGKADTMTIKASSTSRTSSVSSSSTLSSTSASSSPSTVKNESATPTGTSTSSVKDTPASNSEGMSVSPPPVPEPTDESAASTSSTVVDNIPPLILSSSSVATSTVPGGDSMESSPEGSPSVSETISVIQNNMSQSPTSSVTHSSTSTQISNEPSSTDEVPSLSEEEDVDDLEEFLSEIGIGKEPEPEPSAQPPSPPPIPEETKEERQERERRQAIETAEKRADIEGRHSQWEIDLTKFGKAQRKVVRATLTRLREAAAEEARTPGASVRGHVENLVKEAEKSLKSLKAYSRKLAAEDKPEDEKVKTWENIATKVDEKFGERVEVAADAVREWWRAQVDQEVEEVLAIGQEVTQMASRAQDDLGMSYAWLLDVTYEDWQRYHKLVDTSKAFIDLYLAMQNGTHVNAPANPLTEVMEALQEEVDDMILGFEAKLARVKSAALDVFSEKETNTSDAPTATADTQPEVSILPIEPVTAEKGAGEIPAIILSRGAEEIKAAVSRAEEAKTKAAHEEL